MTVDRTVAARLLSIVALVLVAAACGSDDSQDASQPVATTADVVDTEVADDTDTSAADDDGGDDEGAGGDDSADADDAASDAGSGGDATLTLANGETIEFGGVLCMLEPQESAGSVILFTAVSYGDPGLDITQFGDEGTITDVASISVYDAEYETLWEANSMFGSAVELTLDGNTIRGSGSFLEAGDMMNAPVEGEIVANC